MKHRTIAALFVPAALLAQSETPASAVPNHTAPASAQTSAAPGPSSASPASGNKLTADNAPAAAASSVAPDDAGFTLDPGTRIPLSLINSVSTKSATEGDRVYLETVFPIVQNGRIIIPPGSYVAGTVTQVKRPGRAKGKGELYLRFDSLTLPNGVTRDFRARVGALDGRSSESLDKAEGKIKSEGNVGGDARTVGEVAITGASIGGLAGGLSGRPWTGLIGGAAAGAAAGLIGVLFSRGPDAVLAKGTTLEMVLDRPLLFAESELMTGPIPRTHSIGEGPGPAQKQTQTIRRFPL